jgi:hypothetical protein
VSLLLDIPVPLQAGLFPVPVLGRHAGQSSLFALADLFTGGLCLALLLGAHPQIPRLLQLTLPRALVRNDDGNDDHDCDKDPHLV